MLNKTITLTISRSITITMITKPAVTVVMMGVVCFDQRHQMVRYPLTTNYPERSQSMFIAEWHHHPFSSETRVDGWIG